jgi:hypothetical protein
MAAHLERKLYRVGPNCGPTLGLDRDFQSNCWAKSRNLGQPCTNFVRPRSQLVPTFVLPRRLRWDARALPAAPFERREGASVWSLHCDGCAAAHTGRADETVALFGGACGGGSRAATGMWTLDGGTTWCAARPANLRPTSCASAAGLSRSWERPGRLIPPTAPNLSTGCCNLRTRWSGRTLPGRALISASATRIPANSMNLRLLTWPSCTACAKRWVPP